MLENLDRVIMGIECGSERFPFCFGRTHELGSRRVPRDSSIEPSQLKPQQPQICEQQNEDADVSATRPDKPLSPFYLARQLHAAPAPAFRQQIKFHRRRRQFDPDDFSGAGKNSLNGRAQFVAGFVQEHVWIRGIDALQFGAQSQLRQFKLQVIAVAFD